MLKSGLIYIASFYPIRKLFILIETGITKFLGVISIFKLRAFVPRAHNSSSCRWSTLIKYGEEIAIGANTRIGPQCVLGAKGGISIGKNVVISREVQLETAGLDLTKGPPYFFHKAKPIIIEDNCWLGARVIVLGGVVIGEGSIIGAGAVIAKSVPPKSVIVGSAYRNLSNNE